VSANPPQARHVVTAIVVAHDGARMLPGLLRALRGQTYPIQRCVGVDTGSRDGSGAVLAELIGQESVFGLERNTGYGTALAAALEHPASTTAAQTSGIEWIWLLHDDCEPAPDMLEKLLRAAVRDRGIAVVGPKVRDLSDRRVLRETGVTIDRAGRRVTGIEPGEIDQGQHDANRGVLAVGSAGMLIRRDVWDRLKGFDEFFTMFRDDIDFCWRVHAAGYRVQVVTDAVLYHRELGIRRMRDAGGPHPRRLDRKNALYIFAANLPFLALVRILTGCVAGSLLRAGWFVLTKQPERSADHLSAIRGVLGHPVLIWRARRRRGKLRAGYAAVRGYLPRGRTLSRMAESLAGMLTAGPPRLSGGHQATENAEDDQFTDEPSVVRRVLANPGVRLVAALTVIALVAERRLLGAGTLGGGALVPAWASAGSLWQTYLAGFHATGIGSSAIAPPYLAMVAALATVLAGKTWLAVDVLLLGCVPLAGLTAYLAARRVTASVAARVTGAAAYALLPVATGAVAAGRLGTATAFILLPLTGLAAARMVTRYEDSAIARRAAWLTGLALGAVAASVPAIWLVGAVLAGGAAAWTYGERRWLPGGRPVLNPLALSPLNGAIVAITPALVLFPWSLSLLRHPSGFGREAGVLSGPVAAQSAGPRPVSLLMLSPGGPGLPPVWVTAGLLLAVLALLLPHQRPEITWTGWVVAITGFGAAVIVSRVRDASPGAELAVAAAGLILAALPAAEWLASQSLGLSRRLTAGVALAVAASAPLLAAGFWLAHGIRGPVTGVTSQVLPAFVSAASAGTDRPRTLVLRTSGGVVTYSVLRKTDPSLGEPQLTGPDTAANSLSRAVAALVAADGADEGDPGEVLSGYAIRWVLLPGPVDATLAQRLDGAAGLVRESTSASYDLWEVAGTVSRARVVEPDGTVVALASGDVTVSSAAAPRAGGTLLLAEPAGGWTATLNGRALTPHVVDGWEQSFTLPAGGGALSISPNGGWRGPSLILEAIAVLAVCVLALPGKRPETAGPRAETAPEPVAIGTGARASRSPLALPVATAGLTANSRDFRGHSNENHGSLRTATEGGGAGGASAVATGPNALAVPADPFGPAEPADPFSAADPFSSASPFGPAEPVDSVGPVEPAAAAGPESGRRRLSARRVLPGSGGGHRAARHGRRAVGKRGRES
jgi:GT2 family glycosyltransferase